jgi:phosphatidylglycerol:prolipoprotein diacylglycerol transferase
MYPTIFHIPLLHWPIYGYGLMMVFAFLATQWLASKLAALRGLDPEIFVNVALIALVSGVIGSRASHVLENLKYYTDPHLSIWDNLFNMINIRSGGLTFYGGVILASPIVLGYLLYKKVPPRLAMDIVAPCLTLGLAVGRVGCFLNGCCYGAPTNVAWAVQFPYGSSAYMESYEAGKIDLPPELRAFTSGSPDHYRPVTPEEIQQGYYLTGNPESPMFFLPENVKAIAAAQHAPPVHPAELYSTLTALLITAVLLCYFFLPHSPGRVFAMMLMLEGPSRFLLEMLRVEPPVIGSMSLSMVIGLILLPIGILLWFVFSPPKRDLPGFGVLKPA